MFACKFRSGNFTFPLAALFIAVCAAAAWLPQPAAGEPNNREYNREYNNNNDDNWAGGRDGGTYYMAGDRDDADPTTRYPEAIACRDLRPQHSVDILKVMGLWYGSEILMHTRDVPGVYKYDSCVIIHIQDITEEMQQRQRGGTLYQGASGSGSSNNNNNRRVSSYPTHDAAGRPYYHPSDDHPLQPDQDVAVRYLRLVWSEKADNLEYTLNYTLSSPGQWTSMGEQRGPLINNNQYTQFQGSVQVVKAVNDHLVLTFCGSNMHSSIYSIVLTRDSHGLSMDELHSIRNLLTRRGLYTGSVRKVCSAGASSAFMAAASATVMALAMGAFVLLANPRNRRGLV